jgi:hypothetical protein
MFRAKLYIAILTIRGTLTKFPKFFDHDLSQFAHQSITYLLNAIIFLNFTDLAYTLNPWKLFHGIKHEKVV